MKKTLTPDDSQKKVEELLAILLNKKERYVVDWDIRGKPIYMDEVYPYA